MKTNHINYTPKTAEGDRPELTRLYPEDFCKAKYSQQDKRCYTARLLDIFLPLTGKMYPLAYREFRLATMDYLYEHHKEDHAKTAEQRAKCFNEVAEKLGYVLKERTTP